MLEMMMMNGGGGSKTQFLYVQGDPDATSPDDEIQKYEVADGDLVSPTPMFSASVQGADAWRYGVATNANGESAFGVDGEVLYRLSATGTLSTAVFSGERFRRTAMDDDGIVFAACVVGAFEGGVKKITPDNSITIMAPGLQYGHGYTVNVDQEAQRVYAWTRYDGVICCDYSGNLIWSTGPFQDNITNNMILVPGALIANEGGNLHVIDVTTGAVTSTPDGFADGAEALELLTINRQDNNTLYLLGGSFFYSYDLSTATLTPLVDTTVYQGSNGYFHLLYFAVPDLTTGGCFFSARTRVDFDATEYRMFVFDPTTSTTSFYELTTLYGKLVLGLGLE